jgi:integrase
VARGNGEGTIVKRKDGRWMGAVTTGTDPKTGNLKRKYIYGSKRKEVARKMTELKQKLFDGSYIKQSEIKLGEWLTQWNEGRKNSISYNTYKTYEKAIRLHIKPELGEVKLKNLQARQIQNLLNNKYEDGKLVGEGGLSIHSVRGIYRVLNAGLKQAVKEKLIIKCPTEAVELPKSKKEEKMHTWNKEQVIKFLDQARDHKYYMIFFLAVNTGMRRGELLGLKWEDIDFNKMRLEVKRQAQRTDEGVVFTSPKTSSGKRFIPITNYISKELKRHKIRQSEKRLALGNNYKDHDLVNDNEIGDPINPGSIYTEYKKVSRAANLPEIRFHDLRHTFSTLFLENGGNIKTLQQILGHASISQTMDTYSHVTSEMLDNAAKNIEMMYKVTANK